jgi:Asp-tRNA(Asn)/Glu-tRNA(Gln) amidotransferase A subunit family amidase
MIQRDSEGVMRRVSATEALERSAAAIARWEPTVRAWAHLDLDAAASAARRLDGEPAGPMSGVTVGVKDLIDTADLPTEYGSPLFAGHRPDSDAVVVAGVRRAGALVLGKTVTAELACLTPGRTTNPHRPTHTPGGSSMGSAAAVACGMVDVAFGTQTAASVTRPASFCGVYGFKPTFGLVDRTGVKLVSPSLDTIGWFARDPSLLGTLLEVLTGRPSTTSLVLPRFSVEPTPLWERCAPDSHQAVRLAAAAARDAGAAVADSRSTQLLLGLAEAQDLLAAYEAAVSLAWEHAHGVSPALARYLDAGAATSAAQAADALRRRDSVLADVDGLFGDADVLLTPAVVGEAPAGLGSTGDPLMARTWSLLGLPTVAVPCTAGSTGLPVGVQLVGRPGADTGLLHAAAWLGDRLGWTGLADAGVPG